jgi:hypothetical protein
MVTIKVLNETVYGDGSGSAGLYEIAGVRLSGINNGDGKVTVTPIGVRSGFRSWAEKKATARAIAALEARVRSLGTVQS